MKNLFFGALALSMLFVACSKEEVKTNQEEKEQVESTTNQFRLASGDGRQYFFNPSGEGGLKGNGEGCEPHGFDCYYTSLIVADDCVMGPVILDHHMWLEGNATDYLLDYFNENIDELGGYLDATLLTAAVSGELNVKKSGSSDEGGTSYLKFVDASDANVMVYPIIIE